MLDNSAPASSTNQPSQTLQELVYEQVRRYLAESQETRTELYEMRLFDDNDNNHRFFSTIRQSNQAASNANQFSPEFINQKRLEALTPTTELKQVGYEQVYPKPEWICPITTYLIDDPVSTGLNEGFYKSFYERSALMQWFARGKRNDPSTRKEVSADAPIPQPNVQLEIENFLCEQENRKKHFEDCLARGTSRDETIGSSPNLTQPGF